MTDNPFAGPAVPWFLDETAPPIPEPPAPPPRRPRAARPEVRAVGKGGATLYQAPTEPMPEGWRPDPLPSLAGVAEVAVDLETTGLRWWAGDRPCGVAVAWREGEVLRSAYLPFGHQGGGNHDEARVREWMAAELRGKRLVNLNTKFDAHHAREWGVEWAGLVASLGDVAHYAALLDDHRGERWEREERPFSLEAIAQDYVGEGKVKGLDMSAGAHVLPAWQVTPYARRDAELVLRVLAAMRPRLVAEELEAVAALEDAVLLPVLEMERNAAPLDVEKLERWCQESEQELLTLRLRLAAAVGFAPNLNAAADLERLFRTRGVDLPEGRTAKTGRVSFNAAALEAAAAQDEVMRLALEAIRVEDLRSKFLIAYRDAVSADGLLRYSLNQLKGDRYGTVSGRFSCSQPVRGEGANVQQVYSTENQAARTGERWLIRELFVPGAGLLLGADSAQIEFRIFAHLAKAPRLLAAYAADPNVDFHQIVTEDARRFNAELTRKAVKGANFAILFGAGKAKTAELLGMSLGQAEEFLAVYDRAFPEARRLAQLATRTANERGHVRTPLGRRARFPGGERAHKALNSVIQGAAADYHKLKLCALYRERHRLGLTLRMTVHDEVVGDVPDAEAARRVAEVLDAPMPEMPLRVPLLWAVRTGRNWRECK